MEDAVSIVKDARASSIVRFTERHFDTNVDDIRISIRAPFHFRLNAISESKYLTALVASNPIARPFGLDIWTPSMKVLNAEYNGASIELVSIRRGVWEDQLISAARGISNPAGSIAITPCPQIPRSKNAPQWRPVDLVITEKTLASLRDLLRDDPTIVGWPSLRDLF